tara:strand:- start:147 stop:533 length:387 start_codon:yes stop_codon:yes gene_type:complete
MSDTISDLLTRLRNAQNASKDSVDIPFSKLKHSICQVLLNEGYIEKIDTDDTDKKNLRITLKYYEGRPVIEKINRISKPGIRIYKSANEIPIVNNGLGICIVSTSKGVMTDKDARKNNCGGEIICFVS